MSIKSYSSSVYFAAAMALWLGGLPFVATKAAVPDAAGVYTACYHTKSGATRVIDASREVCRSMEAMITWNEAGQPGATGPRGKQGVPGPAGPQGAPGAGSNAAGPCFSDDSRIVDCGNGTLTDGVTGLIWLADPSCFSSTSWASSNAAADTLSDGACGLTDQSSPGDWRLPTADEWRLSRDVVPADDNAIYWSASTDGADATLAMTAKRDNGIIARAKSTSYGVWPVRGGPAPAIDPDVDRNLWRYQPTGTNAEWIKDLGTGLEWQRCSVGQSWDAGSQTCTGDPTRMTWDEAVAQLGAEDHNGFRLPTIAELRTLVYCSNGIPVTINMRETYTICKHPLQRPTIVSWAFPETLIFTPFWSSSPVFEESGAWAVSFGNGYVYYMAKWNQYAARLVRGGQ